MVRVGALRLAVTGLSIGGCAASYTVISAPVISEGIVPGQEVNAERRRDHLSECFKFSNTELQFLVEKFKKRPLSKKSY
jgi:hypothetical protein